MSEKNFVVIAGTNRRDARSNQVAKVIASIYEAREVPCRVYSLTDLPMSIFHPDAYAEKPPEFVEVQQMVIESAGLHVVTPEYNGSYPGALKLFVDMLKFPESFQHKPTAYVGACAGRFGGLRPVEQLQQVFGYRNAFNFPDRVFISDLGSKLDASGKLDAETTERLAAQVEGFVRFARALAGQ